MSEEHIKVLILWILYLSYMLLGTLIFHQLEHENEQLQVKYFKGLFEEFYSNTNASKNDIDSVLRIFRDSYSFGIDPSVSYQPKWDIAGSFYFVGTVITTIGFGFTAPVTRTGQIAFIPYALIGIPLNVLLFNTLLDLTVQLFTFILHHFHRWWRVAKRRISKQTAGSSPWEPTASSIALLCMISVIIITLISAPLFLFLEGWTFFESVYFAVVAFTTVGFGDFVPGGDHSGSGQNLTPHYKIGNWLVIIIGMIFTYPAMAVVASVYKQLLNFVVEKGRKFLAKKTNRVLDPKTSSEHTGNTAELSAEEREKITAHKVLKTWKSLKKANNIGTINAVEASILRSRLSPSNRGDPDSGISMAATSQGSIVEGVNTFDELDAVEARLNREYKQLLNDIKQHRETIANIPAVNDLTATGESIGIANEGIGIAIRICSPPLSERKEGIGSPSSEATNLSGSPTNTD